MPSLGRNADSRSLSSAFSISSGLFSFVLAFTIGQLYANYTRAVGNAKQEASAAAQVLRGERRACRRRSAGAVRRRDARLRGRGAHPRVGAHAHRRREHAGAGRTSTGSTRASSSSGRRPDSDPFYGQTLARLNDLAAARQTRLDDANASLPPIFQVMLLLGACASPS